MSETNYKDFYYQSFGYIPFSEFEDREKLKLFCQELKKVGVTSRLALQRIYEFKKTTELILEKERIKLDILKAESEYAAVELYSRINEFERVYGCLTTSEYLRGYLREHIFYKEIKNV